MSEWRTGWPYDADPFDKVEVEYRNGRRETLEVCEANWNAPNAKDMFSPRPENEIVCWRLLC